MTERLYERFTYRQIVEHYELMLCVDHKTCRRKVSQVKHRYGGADSMGYIHLQDADTRMVTRKGLRTVLKAIARVKLKTFDAPVWERLYLEDTWVMSEAQHTWRVRIPGELNDKDRARVLSSAAWHKVRLRTNHTAIYRWAMVPTYRKEKQ